MPTTPFLTPKFMPGQQAQMMAQRSTEILTAKLTPAQVALCDRKGRRGSEAWRKMAIELTTPRSRRAGRPQNRRQSKPQPKPVKRFLVRTLEYSAGPFDMAILQACNEIIDWSQEDSYGAPVEREELVERDLFSSELYGDAIDFGTGDLLEGRNDEWVLHGFHFTTKP